MTPSQKGAIAEAKITAVAIEMGIVVARPLSEGARYDLIFDTGERLLRVQCKWARRVGDILYVRTYTCRHSPRGAIYRTYATSEIDAVAVYSPDTESCYLVPVERIAGRRIISLRLAPTRNNQAARLSWAADYEFGAIAQLGERRRGTPKVAGSSPASSTTGECTGTPAQAGVPRFRAPATDSPRRA